MKPSILVLLVSCFTLQSYSQKYVKVWSDEFNTPGLPDSTKWGYEVGKVRNSELQYYTYKRSENARIQDTVLIIEARKEDYKGAAYTSASLMSKYKGDWIYGKFEIRAQVPAGKGTWPAIWMLPTKGEYGGWPKSGEIDIMEYVGMNADNLYYTAHYQGTDGSGHQSSGIETTYSQPYSKFIGEIGPILCLMVCHGGVILIMHPVSVPLSIRNLFIARSPCRNSIYPPVHA